MKKEKIVILLASYNGENFIGQQIESILRQDYSNWELWIRDDGSNDDTLNIIRKYIASDKRIFLLDDNNKRLGPQLNFGALMGHVLKVDFDYCMFSDQDDVWYENKVADCLIAVKNYQTECNYFGPILLHTDFQFVDDNLNIIDTGPNVADRIFQYPDKIKVLVNDNYIFGCTMLLSKSLLKISTPVDKFAENHDFWVALHAAVFGRIFYLNKKTMYYRQHTNNVSRGLKYSSWSSRIFRLFNFAQYIEDKNKRAKQLSAFVSKNQDAFADIEAAFFKGYLTNISTGGIKAVLFMLVNKVRLRGAAQTVLFYISVFFN